MEKNTKLEVSRLYRYENGGPIKAYCDIQLDGDCIIKGFKVVEGKDGVFVGMPSEVGKNGKWFPTFMALNDGFKSRIEEAVLAAYEE